MVVNTASIQSAGFKAIRRYRITCFLAGDASGEEDSLGSGGDDDDDDEEMTEVNVLMMVGVESRPIRIVEPSRQLPRSYRVTIRHLIRHARGSPLASPGDA